MGLPGFCCSLIKILVVGLGMRMFGRASFIIFSSLRRRNRGT